MHSSYFMYTIPQSGNQNHISTIPIVNATNVRTAQISNHHHPHQQNNAAMTNSTAVIGNTQQSASHISINCANERNNQNSRQNLASSQSSNSSTEKVEISSQSVCDICGQSFKKSSSLLKHMRVHRTKNPQANSKTGVNNGTNPFVCNTCKIDYINAATFEHHIRTQHGNPQVAKCIDCGCFRSIGLSMNQPFRCEVCLKRKTSEFVVTNTSEYSVRMNSNASTSKNDPLDTKPSKIEMDILVQTMRHGETNGRRRKMHECPECGKTYKHQSTLAMHKKVHTGDYKFKCEYCDKEFYLAEYYNRHLRVHTKEKPYQCDVCEKAFSQSNTLIQHKRIHTGS